MGTRYHLQITCPKCGILDDDVYYAPTCGFTDWTCECGHKIDLELWTGISYEEASNIEEMTAMLEKVR